MPREGDSVMTIAPTVDAKPWQVWSCGGGVQSAAIGALIVSGRLPKPDHAVMVDTERERASTWRFVDGTLQPALAAAGVTLHVVKKSTYATVDLWSGADGETLTIPAYTDQSGSVSKLPEFCSGEWKRDVVMRWCRAIGLNRVDCWLGISTDEQRRRRGPKRQWFQPVYPLLDLVPLSRSGCYKVVHDLGWPEPPRSCCYQCPNMADRQWADMKANDPDDFRQACELDAAIRQVDPHVWLHKSCMPLGLVEFKTDGPDLFGGGCTTGMCY